MNCTIYLHRWVAQKLKVQGAPSVYINGNLANPDFDSMKKAIDKELKK